MLVAGVVQDQFGDDADPAAVCPRISVEQGVLRLHEWLLELTGTGAEQVATAG